MQSIVIALLTLSALLCSVGALAGSVTYSFSGTLTDIRGAGAGLVFGTHFNATYDHDDAPQVGSLIEPGRQLFSGGHFTVSAGDLALAGGSTSELQVFNNWTSTIGGYQADDGYFVSSTIYDTDGKGFYLIQFDLWDFTGET